MKRVILTLLLCLGSALPVLAQVRGGSISGTIKDEQGGVLPGTSVTAQGADATRTSAAASNGEFHFLDLAPGPYKITAALEGFTTVVRDSITVSVGRDIHLPISLNVAGVTEVVTVSAAGPIVNATPVGTAANFTSAELLNIPTSRDPFALIRAVPGALTDRVNIGGNETGQQLLVVSKGGRQQDTSWTLDGVEITDMAAAGQAATYFNFDNFDEIHASTAGNDIRERTGALTIDLVVKRGGNQYHGGARGYYTGDSLQASNIPTELSALSVPVTRAKADHMTRASDYGFDLGGPIFKDRAWFYGSYSAQNVHVYRRTTGAIDRTKLNNPNLKVNAQVTSKDLVNFLFYNGYKIKDNRAPGTTAIELPGATWHQDNQYSDSPFHGLWKIADDRIFNSHLFLSAKYAYFNTGIALTPEGGMNQQAGRNSVTTTAYGSFMRSLSTRPQHSATADLHSFFSAAGGSHDVKYGLGFRSVTAFTEGLYPGNGILAITSAPTDLRAQVYREGNGGNRTKYFDFYVGDSIARSRFTFDLALRYDRQWGQALPSSSQGNPLFPAIVPGISFAGYDSPFVWSNFSPRVGVLYALDGAGKTAARVTYGRFAGQLATSTVGTANVAAGNGSITYRWTDLDGDGFVSSADEVNTALQIGLPSGINLANPTAVTSPSQIDAGLKAPLTQSVVVGIEREVMPNLAVHANYTYSRTSNLFGNEATNITPRVGLTLSDYTPGSVLTGSLPDGTPFSVQTYSALDGTKVTASGGGFVVKNVPGYYTDYNGLELGLVKRLSNRWMGRATFSYNNAREHFSDPAGKYDTNGNPTPTVTEPLIDGGQFVSATGTATGSYYLNAKWQLNVNGMYEAPYGIQVAANIFGRQGYPFPIFRRQAIPLGTTTETLSILVSPKIDTFRYPNVWDTDLRFAREFSHQRVRVRLIADVFNLLNANAPLLRVNDIAATSFNTLQQNMTPRILRFGVVIGF